MKNDHVESEPSHLLIDLSQSEKGGLLKTGVFSLLFHIVLISSLILNLKTGITKGDSPVYRVTIQPLRFQTNSNPHSLQALHPSQPIPEKGEIQKREENKPKEEAKQSELVKEQKQLPKPQEDEQTVQRPIPLPMAETPTLNMESDFEKEEILASSTVLSSEEKDKNTLSESNAGESTGRGIGGGGSTLGGGPRWVGIGEGTGTEQGGSHWVSSGDGSGTGRGSRKGTGTGRGGGQGGSGGSGSGGSRPNYIENPKPDYPLEAKNKGYEGKVLLQVEILSNGRVGDIFLKESSGYESLDQSALVTVKKWRFIPAKKGEVPYPCWVNIPITFRLQDSSF